MHFNRLSGFLTWASLKPAWKVKLRLAIYQSFSESFTKAFRAVGRDAPSYYDGNNIVQSFKLLLFEKLCKHAARVFKRLKYYSRLVWEVVELLLVFKNDLTVFYTAIYNRIFNIK